MRKSRYHDRARLALELDRPRRDPPVARDTRCGEIGRSSAGGAGCPEAGRGR